MTTALIVGASRGIGLGLAHELLQRGSHVIATQRDQSRATGLAALQKDFADRLRIERVDINNADEVTTLHRKLAGEKLDVLIVNAGIGHRPADAPAAAVPAEDFNRLMITNAYSPIRFAETFLDRVKRDGVIGFMSSVLGSVSGNMGGGNEVYRASKAALNTLSRSFYARHRGDVSTVLTLHPGWVKTDMGGPGAAIDVKTSVRGLADVITRAHGEGGHRYVDYQGNTIAW